MKKLTITGTKGKTTVSNVLASVLRSVEKRVLNVDTTGAYLNSELVVSKAQSQRTWDVVPTVAPGRFLYLLAPTDVPSKKGEHHGAVKGVAVLEASLGCGTVSGLGYYGHDVGIFTNVYEDHLGSRPDLKSKKDIADSKKFIFSRINSDGYAVFNADDEYVCSMLSHCKEAVQLIPFGIRFSHFDVKNHLKNGGVAVSVQEGSIVILEESKTSETLRISDVGWAFEGRFTPSVYNLMAVTGGLIGYSEGNIPSSNLLTALAQSKLDPSSGRLVLFRNDHGIRVLADYAHEKQSLESVAKLAHDLKAEGGRVIGVLRLTWDRTEELIRDTAQHISHSYDHFVIYDKIDGYWREPSSRFRTNQRQFTQEVGKISGWFADELTKQVGKERVQRILREDEAISYAAQIARPGDVVVFIVNDDIERSITFIKDTFKAELV